MTALSTNLVEEEWVFLEVLENKKSEKLDDIFLG